MPCAILMPVMAIQPVPLYLHFQLVQKVKSLYIIITGKKTLDSVWFNLELQIS